MKRLTLKYFLVFFLIFSFGAGLCEAVPVKLNISPEMGGIQPRKAKKAQKKQDKKEKNKKKDIKEGSKAAQKRSYEIQSPEVQARMKQNKKDAAARDKTKKKNIKSGTKKGAKKYR